MEHGALNLLEMSLGAVCDSDFDSEVQHKEDDKNCTNSITVVLTVPILIEIQI
jgi:hypothetical protein